PFDVYGRFDDLARVRLDERVHLVDERALVDTDDAHVTRPRLRGGPGAPVVAEPEDPHDVERLQPRHERVARVVAREGHRVAEAELLHPRTDAIALDPVADEHEVRGGMRVSNPGERLEPE